MGKIDEAIFGRFERVQSRVIIFTIFYLLWQVNTCHKTICDSILTPEREHSKELHRAAQWVQNVISQRQVEAPLKTEEDMSNLSEDISRMVGELLALFNSLVSKSLTYLNIWTPEKRENAIEEFRSVRSRMMIFTPFSLW